MKQRPAVHTGGVRLLIAEDEERLGRLLHQAASEVGWQPTVVPDGEAAVRAVRSGGFDVLLLDWMLPGLEGPAVVEVLRREGHRTPVLMLTARGDLQDRVHGLTVGADDYLAKPFELPELIARLQALHRRARPDAVVAFRAGDLLVDPAERTVSRAGVEIRLSAREFDVLTVLVEHAGRYVSRYTILDEAWDGETDIASNVIDVHVGRLRAKIDTPFGRSAIQTLRGVGYRLDPAGG
jgi:two-component system OmpR family response regulator